MKANKHYGTIHALCLSVGLERKEAEMEPEIKVTKIANRWHARMMVGDEVRDEMACELRCDIGWISREMLRWHQKMGGHSVFASAARKRQTTGAKGRIWWNKDLRSNAIINVAARRGRTMP